MTRFLDALSHGGYLRRRFRLLYTFAILSTPVTVACGPHAVARLPLPEPETAAASLRERHAPQTSRLTLFRWRYYGREGNFGGEGAMRLDTADRARVDLLGSGSATVEVAVLRGDTLRLASDDPEVQLPPPAFLWAMAGVFRPPSAAPTRGRTGDGVTVLEYDGERGNALRFVFGREGRLERVVDLRDDRPEHELSLTWGEAGAVPAEVPRAAEFRDHRHFRRIRLEVMDSRAHAPFDPDLFCVKAC